MFERDDIRVAKALRRVAIDADGVTLNGLRAFQREQIRDVELVIGDCWDVQISHGERGKTVLSFRDEGSAHEALLALGRSPHRVVTTARILSPFGAERSVAQHLLVALAIFGLVCTLVFPPPVFFAYLVFLLAVGIRTSKRIVKFGEEALVFRTRTIRYRDIDRVEGETAHLRLHLRDGGMRSLGPFLERRLPDLVACMMHKLEHVRPLAPVRIADLESEGVYRAAEEVEEESATAMRR